MKRFFSMMKFYFLKAYDFIQDLNDIPMRNFSDGFYEERRRDRPIRRETKTKVEDLRPPKAD